MASDTDTLRDGWESGPARSRLTVIGAQREEVLARHDAASRSGFASYADPASGFAVFTADFLASRGYCCESGCRHCPYVEA